MNLGAEKIRESLLKLDKLAREQDYKGYDPYDLLGTRLPLEKLGTKACYYLTQLNKRDPFSMLRTILGVKKQYVPKGLALFIESYTIWKEAGLGDRKETALWLKKELDALRSPNYGDKFCWGLNYIYATSLTRVSALSPSVVVTAYAHRAYYSLMKHYPELDFTDQLESGVRFLLEDLERTEDDDGICFSYYTNKKDIVYNANAKAAEMLARVYTLTNKEEYRQLAFKSMDHVVHNQKKDGRWNYRRLDDGKERKQIDFHQSYIIESLYRFILFLDPTDTKYSIALDRGVDFYLNQQLKQDGTCYYRWPTYWPIDIHNQASGILILSRLSEIRPDLQEFAVRMAKFTIENMQLSNGGFMYRKHRIYNNKTSYIRWANAWMHLALTTLLTKLIR